MMYIVHILVYDYNKLHDKLRLCVPRNCCLDPKLVPNILNLQCEILAHKFTRLPTFRK